jgi:AraC family transcriptional regulator, transcriptional activator of the genes for pyochelin and ferripyochelin receptors
MIRHIIDINDFTILVEESTGNEPSIDACKYEEPVIGAAFYGSGDVDLTINYGDNKKDYKHTKGLALSFYADEKVEFVHHVHATKPLQSVVIVTAVRNLAKLPNAEGDLFSELLHQLVNPADHYVEGPRFLMTPEMQSVVDKVFNIHYEGKTKMMFFRSQMTTLLSHFFGHLATNKEAGMKDSERDKLYEAKEILSNNLDAPPSLSELSKKIGLNSFKLKKNFKELFGVPVFKYLQNQRMEKAYELLQGGNVTIQEAAWNVGYDSLSSFSNAFSKKYGFRPSEIKQ